MYTFFLVKTKTKKGKRKSLIKYMKPRAPINAPKDNAYLVAIWLLAKLCADNMATIRQP